MNVCYGTKDSSSGNHFGNGYYSGDHESPPTPLPSWRNAAFRIFVFDHGSPPEATGLALNSVARGAAAMSTIFLGPALLKLAQQAAAVSNCDFEGDDEAERDVGCGKGGRVYGMRPTSLLTNIGVLSGLLSSALTPLFGSVVDHTPHRRAIGWGSAMALSAVKGVEILVGPSTWFFVSVLQVLNSVLYNAYLCTIYAYTAELSTSPDEQTRYNSRFQMVYYVSLLAFLICVMIASTALGTNDVGTARISQTLAFAVCTAIFGLSWKYFFRPVPVLRKISNGSTLLRSGFQKLSSTSLHIWGNWRALRFFLLSVMLSESATAALSTISTTYMTHVLEMGAGEIGKVFLCVFVAGIPGARLGGIIGEALNPLRSALLCLGVFVVNTSLAALILTGPESWGAMYGCAAVWGICLSWLHPTHASLYCTIIPRGQESELMGIYIFSGLVMNFLPPLLFSFLNEMGASMSIGLASLNLFFAGGIVFLVAIGNYHDAVAFSRQNNDNTDMAREPPIADGNHMRCDDHSGLTT